MKFFELFLKILRLFPKYFLKFSRVLIKNLWNNFRYFSKYFSKFFYFSTFSEKYLSKMYDVFPKFYEIILEILCYNSRNFHTFFWKIFKIILKNVGNIFEHPKIFHYIFRNNFFEITRFSKFSEIIFQVFRSGFRKFLNYLSKFSDFPPNISWNFLR